MKKGLKRFLSTMLTAVVASSAFAIADIAPVGIGTAQTVQAASGVNGTASGDITVNEADGYQEGAYVEWADVSGAVQYVVSYQKSGASGWTRIDDQLIRKYATYWRADIVGLAAGTYSIKIDAYGSNGSITKTSTVSGINVIAYVRDGFAFKTNSSTPGAYNKDGTLKAGATVIYVTKDTPMDSITLTEGGVTGTGFGDSGITSEKVHGKLASPGPLCIRIIGTANPSGIVKVKANKDYKNMFITFEGIGEDAVIHEGFDIQKSANVEIKNLGIGNFSDDGISIQSKNKYVWVHNVDLYYGNAGGDKDQAKGDGSLDVKNDSQYCEFSFNHFWDSGKSSLCGMKSESGPNFIAYHHNWFDHSDSRHPRVRTMSVHVYNNLFDGVSKYGPGAAARSSIFVENNVFKNCKHPMLSSMQGSDIMEQGGYNADNGTFSGEDSGVIKAYNNTITGADKIELYSGSGEPNEPIYYGKGQTSDSTTQFDAYLASSRDEQVPSSVKGLQGGQTYDNEGLDVSKLATPEDVNTVEATVTKYAGTVGEDILNKSDYPAMRNNTDYGVDSALKSAVTNYDSNKNIESVGGTVKGGSPVAPTESTTENTEPTSQAVTEEDQPEVTTKAPVGAVGSQEHNFDDYSDESDFYTFVSYSPSSSKGDVAYNGRTYHECAKMTSSFTVSFTNGAGAKGRLTLVFNPKTCTGGSIYFDDQSYDIPAGGVLVIDNIEGGKTHTFKKHNVETHLYYILYEDLSVETSSEATTSSSTTTTEAADPEKPTESTTAAPVDLRGDVDGNGVVEMKDAKTILDYLSGLVTDLADKVKSAADVNKDGTIDGKDAYEIAGHILS